MEEQRAAIEAQIQMLETQRLKLEKQMCEELQYMRDANRDEMDNQDIYESMSGILKIKCVRTIRNFMKLTFRLMGWNLS